MTRIGELRGSVAARWRSWKTSPMYVGQKRALRLLGEASRGWTIAVIALVLALALLPNLVLISMGYVIGYLPKATASGFSSPAGHDLVTALVVAGAFLVAALLVGPYEGFLKTIVRINLNDSLQSRLVAAVSGPTGIAHLEDPEVLDKVANAQGLLLNVAPSEAPVVMAELIGDRLSGVIACGVVAWYQWWLGLGLLVMWVLIRQPIHRNLERQASFYMAANSLLRRAYYFLQTAVRPEPAKELRVFGLGEWVLDEYRSHWHRAMAPSFAHRKQYSKTGIWLAGIVLVAYAIAGGSVAWAGVHHELGIGAVSVILVMLIATSSAGGITLADFLLTNMLPALPDLDALEATLGAGEGVLSGGMAAVGLPRQEVRFERVTFGYPRTSVNVLRDLDLRIPAGRCTAIVGLNGAGKTTLIKLLTRLHDPGRGSITVDGQPLTDFSPTSWRRQVSVVYQDFIHYPLSAKENVGLGAHEHLDDMEGVLSAVRRTGSLQTVESLPSGWETVLSRSFTDGADVSGGQWQRLALARALFAVQHGARLLVLDEPTAWLDVRGEAEFFDRFLDITAGVTSIIISHRFSTVRRADHICVLDQGHVTERGTHDELITEGGHYASMFLHQAARFSGPEVTS